jgi:Ca2+-binding RTX toxin-like protein
VLGQKPIVNLDDSGDTSPRSIDMVSDTPYGYLVTGLLPQSSLGRGRVWLELDPAAPVTLKTGAGATATNDVFHIHDLTVAPALTIDAGNGSNTLVGPDQATTWTITGANSGTLGNLKFSLIQNLVGGSAGNVFQFGPSGSLSGSLKGGSGTDWLDYSALSATVPVTVNLGTGSATAVAGGVHNIQNVRGGAGNDTLTGNGGNILIGGGATNILIDTYTESAASGRSLLIGGTGKSNLTAGSAGDILIADTTSYDANYAALQSILAEWQSADSYQLRFQRIEGLQSGGLNGTNQLVWGSMVKGAAGASALTGGGTGAGLDWFFANYPGSNATIKNFDAPGDEFINNAP